MENSILITELVTDLMNLHRLGYRSLFIRPDEPEAAIRVTAYPDPDSTAGQLVGPMSAETDAESDARAVGSPLHDIGMAISLLIPDIEAAIDYELDRRENFDDTV